MFESLYSFAQASSGDNVFTSLGIDWKILIFQTIGFLVLVFVIAKWVMPPLLKAVDSRQQKIEEATKAAAEAEQNAKKSEESTQKKLDEARKQAADIVATAKKEANAMAEAAEKRAEQRAETIVANAREQIEKDVIAAKKVLHNETIELVALATEKVVSKKVSQSLDNQTISEALKEVR